jgi:phosphohistidine swiveling domain-containing protein
VGARDQWIVPLSEAASCQQDMVGGKAAKLAQLVRAGFPVPNGFCVTTRAYERFVSATGLVNCIGIELGRKALDGMRWEEIWDIAMRIRSEFLRTEVPEAIAAAVDRALDGLVNGCAVAVRSSAPGEDAPQASFAGLHESVVGVVGHAAVRDALRTVWASLWSDAALLYRRELALDPLQSRMAVVVQEVEEADCSGVAFGRDPRDPQADCAIIEAVPGQCALLVDGSVDPDRWTLERSSGAVTEWRPGRRGEEPQQPLLDQGDLETVLKTLQRVEELFAWPPDIEWTGRSAAMVLLQARPITTAQTATEDQRTWYLSLRPGARRLRELAGRVTGDLIPRLEAEGTCFAAEELAPYDDSQLAAAIEERLESLHKWQKIYRDEFIPFAHGVRQLARYYNDMVRPADPYEFVGLLKSQDMLASQRNRAMARLAARLRTNVPLKDYLADMVGRVSAARMTASREPLDAVRRIPGGAEFLEAFDVLSVEFMDIAYGSERLLNRPDLLLHALVELARDENRSPQADKACEGLDSGELERRFFAAVGAAQREEAAEVLRIGRVSWRLRDDDNLLLSRVESQLFRAVDLALDRIRAAGRLSGEPGVAEEEIPAVVTALRDQASLSLNKRTKQVPASQPQVPPQERPRQLIGNPAAAGLVTGKVRRVMAADDIKRFRAGEVLVCDAIQPMMTHLVPLAAGIVERRGGMLIHGAIIAREMAIPCVNGIAGAVDLLEDGEIVTVDGHLGIVTVGLPEFDLELK